MKSKVVNSIIIICSVLILLGYMFFVDGPDKILEVFLQAKLWWLVAGVGCMVVYWLLESLIVHISLYCFHANIPFAQSFKTCMIGQFFNCVTPSATGGQPMQAYYMTKIGVGAGYGTSALLVRFIVYQIGLTLYNIFALIFQYDYFAQQVTGFQALIIFGFTVNSLVCIFLLLVGFSKRTAGFLIHGAVFLLAKLHIVKDKQKTLAYADEELTKFNDGFRIIKRNGGKLVQMFLLTIVQLTAFFIIPTMIAYAFSVPVPNIFIIITAAACVQMASSFIPLPGAAGGAEFSFYMLFGMFFPAAKLSSAVLVWRLFTFYMPILIGLYFVRNVFGKIPDEGGIKKLQETVSENVKKNT